MKYALVTGGSRGIGRTIAETLSREGYKTIIILQLFYGES
jgi:NAD(P)-dependent dehydrogenase (short-subunit alcohol dehydrogenase family)